MIGFDPLMVASLLILAGTPVECPAVKPTEINILPKTLEVQYDYSRSMADLQKEQTDTIDPYAFHGMTITQGFMQGQIKMQPSIKIGSSQFKRIPAACLWYEQINIELEIDPKIVIAKEIYRDRCIRQAVIEHEMKHVKVDRQIVNKYSKIIGQKLYAALQERGFKSTPVRIEEAQSIAERMQRIIYQVVEHEYQKMALERTEKQRAVDNLTEYEGVDAKCPDFKMPDNVLGQRR